jgi:hypothetical protein
MNEVTTIIPATGSQLGLNLPEIHTLEEWSGALTWLIAIKYRCEFAIGDMIDRGVAQFGSEAFEMANRIFRAHDDRLAPILDVARRFPEGKRHDRLKFGHHLAVMAVKDDEQAEHLLCEAEEQHLTVAALKAHIRVKTDRQANMLPDDDPEDAAMRLIAQAWNRAPLAARESFLELAKEAALEEIDL